MEEFGALSGAREPALDTLSAEFDGLLARMQTPRAAPGMKSGFERNAKTARQGGGGGRAQAWLTRRRAPCIYVLAGTNGAGKSSIAGACCASAAWNTSTRTRRRGASCAANPGSTRRGQQRRLAAGQAPAGARHRRAPRLRVRDDARRQHDHAPARASGLRHGIEVRIWYVGLSSPELHVARVRARVAKGGHDIPEARIRERYDAGRLNLIRLLPAARPSCGSTTTATKPIPRRSGAGTEAGTACPPRGHHRSARSTAHAGMGQGDRGGRHEDLSRSSPCRSRGPGLHFGAGGRIQHGGAKIRITAGRVTADAVLNASRTAAAIWDALPLDIPGETWGDEIYFGIPVMAKAENAREVVELGDLAYWPPGSAFCIFFGRRRRAGATRSGRRARSTCSAACWAIPRCSSGALRDQGPRRARLTGRGWMKIFLDSANVAELREGVAMGLVDGCTTNPSLIAKEKRPFRPLVEEICRVVTGDVSLEVVATDFDGMVKEGKELVQVAPNVVVKCPLTKDGLKAVKYLTRRGHPRQPDALLLGPPGAALRQGGRGLHQPVPRPPRRHRPRGHGPDPGHPPDLPQLRLQDPGAGGLDPQPDPRHRRGQGRGARGTMPFNVLEMLIKHPLTDIGLKKFLDDWAKLGEKI